MPRKPRVLWKTLGVPPISEFDWNLLVNCWKGCRLTVKKLREGAANQKRLRNTGISGWKKKTVTSTQCAKDSCPHDCSCKYFKLVFTRLKLYFYVCVLFFFLTSTCKESSSSMKHAKNYHADYKCHNPWHTLYNISQQKHRKYDFKLKAVSRRIKL